jgi:glycosyltransferase involved in cell wall biosynthesis
MSDLMEAADVIVFPFRHTSGPSDYPTAMLEAMAIGTPVVATNVGGIPEVVVDGETGLLIPKDQPAALLTAVERMLDNPEKAVAMATVAQRMAQDRFNPEVVSRQWDELYESISAPSGAHTYAR